MWPRNKTTKRHTDRTSGVNIKNLGTSMLSSGQNSRKTEMCVETTHLNTPTPLAHWIQNQHPNLNRSSVISAQLFRGQALFSGTGGVLRCVGLFPSVLPSAAEKKKGSTLNLALLIREAARPLEFFRRPPSHEDNKQAVPGAPRHSATSRPSHISSRCKVSACFEPGVPFHTPQKKRVWFRTSSSLHMSRSQKESSDQLTAELVK